MKTPDYLSYERYKKRKETNPNKRLYLFLITFFITLLAFTLFAKLMTPDVDVTIGGDTEVEAKDTGLGVKRFIDERLKLIQMEDNSAGVSQQVAQKDSEYNKNADNKNDYDSKISEEAITLPDSAKERSVMPDYVEPQSVAPKPRSTTSTNSYSSESSVSKVYVGKYATIEQARVAQEIIMDSRVVTAPFIKNINGSYTIQVGTFTNRQRAEEVAAALKNSGFPARIEQE